MRPPHLLWALSCLMAFPLFLVILSSSNPRDAQSEAASAGYGSDRSGRLRSLFSFRSPLSLFPPSAVIRLTDDNSTFFLARPAAFGPPLPAHGLSSPLWVGSGFGEERHPNPYTPVSLEGELGCSDVPGWREDDKPSHGQSVTSATYSTPLLPRTSSFRSGHNDRRSGKDREGNGDDEVGSVRDDDPAGMASLSDDDGTDDHLHHPLPESEPAPPSKPGQMDEYDATRDRSRLRTHADIKSLQETAEITGKTVLLSRGGCGFLEKVKWVQRRGGIALIVGDDVRGGPLITMYARGDTSNVTIPALFTSHTTAHLLSSLIPPEGRDGSMDTRRQGRHASPGRDADGVDSRSVPPKRPARDATPAWTTGEDGHRSLLSRFAAFLHLGGGTSEPARSVGGDGDSGWRRGWSLSGLSRQPTPPSPPEPTLHGGNGQGRPDSPSTSAMPSSTDNFLIGVQDWRDPDMLVPLDEEDGPEAHEGKGALPTSASNPLAPASPAGSGLSDIADWRGDGIAREFPDHDPASRHGPPSSSSPPAGMEGAGWANPLRWFKPPSLPEAMGSSNSDTADDGQHRSGNGPSVGEVPGPASTIEHEGLWVTLAPAAMSTSPFFDTLLVMVVSPLVTLTVVYSLLVLRSRIRRRRWRAPKSVVDRLPVRIYHTMSRSSSSAPSSQWQRPLDSSPASPLLPSSSRPMTSPPRSRAQTASGAILSPSLPPDSRPPSSSLPSPSSPKPAEKMAAAPIWRHSSLGRQVECCVCLEEYVDGQSRVMRLPCGHEFHADCITPWLVTKRRTCPICKGDVVKSMPSGSSREAAPAETDSEMRSANIAIPSRRTTHQQEDLEQGRAASATLTEDHHLPRSSWPRLAAAGMSALSGRTAVWPSSSSDRPG